MIKNLLGRQLLFFDGAMATELQKRGLKTGEIPDLWNITSPDTVRDIHKQYLDAGCDIIKTNTFGSNSHRLAGSGFTPQQIIDSAVNNAKKAIASCGQSKPRFTALDIGPTGKLLKPLGDIHFDEAYALFSDVVKTGAKAGADIVLIETMSDVYELKAAVLAVKENCDLPVIASVTLDENGKMLTGSRADVITAVLEGLGVDAIGFNCGYGHKQLEPFVLNTVKAASVPVLFMPNAGLPEYINGAVHYNTSPQEFAESLRQSAEKGVWLLGGCCGTTPEHIKALVKTCAAVTPPAITRKHFTIAASYRKTITFGDKPVIIGERINPTGKPKLKEALKNGDYEYILHEGIKQAEQGADALDVNAGVPGIDEESVLVKLLEQLQGVIDIPLQIDTANMEAMSRTMKLYNGKPIINSVNGKKSVMDTVFPFLKKYGGIAVALTLDENGIPETAQGRIDIAKKILEHAEQYGIEKEAFLFDPLTMAVSAGQNNALVTLECVRRLKNELHVKTILGVSNVSFGLPCRDKLTSAFLSLAIDAGLDAAIMNPAMGLKSAPDDTAINALLGKDENFTRYIETYGSNPAGAAQNAQTAAAQTENIPLSEAILKGLKQQSASCAQKSLEKLSPLEVIERELIPALNTAGERFESGVIFLPQLLMTAEAAKNAFALIREELTRGQESADTMEDIGTVIIASVEGDIHDIGKNIVRVMLESYRFNVIDLGKDVPAANIVEAVKRYNVKLVGLSALMTTTVVYMEKTIKALREAVPGCKIMCGGAVLTEEYAKRIGADFFGKDAMASVRYAQQVFASGAP
jgi:5-methyltetrahydrofolate--homocysteine methyltransferase